MKNNYFLLALFVGLLFVSCGQRAKSAEEAACDYVQMLHDDDGEAIVNAFMQDSLPAQYRDLMVARMMQLSQTIKAQEGQLKDVQVLRSEQKDGCAIVFIRLTYDDGHTQDISLTLLKQGDRWLVS